MDGLLGDSATYLLAVNVTPMEIGVKRPSKHGEPTPKTMTDPITGSNSEKYTHGHHESVVSAHAVRRASEAAAFVLPQLQSPMRILDFGCGPGTITTDLAEHVLPDGSVVGIDSSDQVIDQARKLAIEKDISNVKFETNSIYDTGYDESSFAAVYAHQVLQHLSEPVQALTEAKRVLKPGGICAVREVDWGASVVFPPDARLSKFFDVYNGVADRNGGDAFAGRRLKVWFEEAGFSDLKTTTSTWTFAEESGLKWWGEQWADRILNSDIASRAIEYGIATQNDLAEISQGWLDWVKAEGAFFAFMQVEVVGVKP